MKKLLVAQSSGPTSVINSTLAGVFDYANKQKIDVLGAFYGIDGVLKEKIVNLNEQIKTQQDIELLKLTPACALGSCRYKLKEDEYEKIHKIFNKYDIGYFIYIGGNDSMDTVNKLSQYFNDNDVDIKVLGAPKTIDNDLVLTDHTPGFGSAAKYVANAIFDIAKDIDVYDYETITIVEAMGRESGYLTASGAIAKYITKFGADIVILSEDIFDYEKLKKCINKVFEYNKNVLILISEGIKNKEGNYISEDKSEIDQFGHTKIEGPALVIKKMLQNDYDIPIRLISLNILQRCATQSLTDVNEAFEVGAFAAKSILEGESSKMVSIRRLENRPYRYELELVEVKNVANKIKMIDKSLINDDYTVNEKIINYILPLIEGEANYKYEYGMPMYFKFKKD